MTPPIRLIDHQQVITFDWLASQHDARILACDFYVSGAENSSCVPGGFESGRVVNIDHHSDAPRMTRRISSTNLAIERMHELGPEPPNSLVIVTHTDCDSVLSAAIVAGVIPPDAAFGEAAICADHTGEPNEIADLLQSIDNRRDFNFSLASLRRLMSEGETALDPIASAALADYRRKRSAAADAVASGVVKTSGRLAFGVLADELDGGFFPALCPEAWAVLLVTLRPDGKWNAKIRLGNAAPDGASLHNMRIAEFDADFGGRWNAGSNKRNDGTITEPEQYAEEVLKRLTMLELIR